MYEIFIYKGYSNFLIGNYHAIKYKDAKPRVGIDAGGGYVVSHVCEALGIVSVVCEPKKQ